MNKVILNTEIQNVELKPGQVICMYDSKTKTHHNMIVFPCKDRMCAVEELFCTDSIIVNWETGANYCYLDQQKYPQTLGISPEFGDTVTAIYPHLDYCSENEEIITISFYDENEILCTRNNL